MIHHFKDIKYSSHERNYFDIFIPDEPKSTSGVILYIHGGGWSDGDKSVHFSEAEFMAENGYVSASMNYRFVTEEINVFHELEDIASCLNAIKYFCENKGFDTEKVILCGGSAGAHLAMLYGYHFYKKDTLQPVAVCAYCPPVNCFKNDFLLGISGEFEDWKYEILSKCCGNKITKETFTEEAVQNALKKISPVEYVSGDSVPTAVFHGKYDKLVPYNHITDFIDSLNMLNIYNEFLVFENSDHALKDNEECSEQAKEIIISFANKFI